jgi:hypothetical protein
VDRKPEVPPCRLSTKPDLRPRTSDFGLRTSLPALNRPREVERRVAAGFPSSPTQSRLHAGAPAGEDSGYNASGRM